MIKTISVLSKQDVLNSQVSSEVVVGHQAKNWYGGNFFDTLENIVGRIGKAVVSAAPYVRPLIDIGKEVLGSGSRKAKAAKPKKVAKVRKGGSYMSRSELKEMMKEDSDDDEE